MIHAAYIFANTQISPLKFRAIFKKIKKNSILIACDGAAHIFKKNKVSPDIVIGDFDSIHEKDKNSVFNKNDTLFIKDKNQDTTDLEKALQFCQKNKIYEINIFLAFGDRADHSLYNIALLKKYHSKKFNITLHTQYEKVFYIKNEKIELKNLVRKRISFFAIKNTKVTTSGLRFNVNNKSMLLAKSDSISNLIQSKNAWISAKNGGLIVMLCLERSD